MTIVSKLVDNPGTETNQKCDVGCPLMQPLAGLASCHRAGQQDQPSTRALRQQKVIEASGRREHGLQSQMARVQVPGPPNTTQQTLGILANFLMHQLPHCKISLRTVATRLGQLWGLGQFTPVRAQSRESARQRLSHTLRTQKPLSRQSPVMCLHLEGAETEERYKRQTLYKNKYWLGKWENELI